MQRIGRVFLAGLLASTPLILTVAATAWIISLIIEYLGPGSSAGRVLTSVGLGVDASSAVPYVLGLLVALALIYVIGLIVESRFGAWIVDVFESMLLRVPILSNIYGLSKTFTSLVDTQKGENLKGMSPVWCFFGGEPGAAVLALLPSAQPVTLGGTEYLGIIVPSAPVPFGGALIYVPAKWVRPAEGGVEHLMKVYVSMGATAPQAGTAVAGGAKVEGA